MIYALKLEWLKLRHYRVFWILIGMYFLSLLVITSFGIFFLEWLKAEGADIDGLDPTLLPIYDFPDIWQNTTYLGSFAKILLAFLVIISVNNDTSYNTLRQNVIDGISKKQYLLSKFMLIVTLGLFSTLSLLVFGLINGSIYSNVWGLDYIFSDLEFLFAYFYDIVIYCMLAFLLALWIKKAGFVIVFLFLYSIMFEPIAVAIFENAPYFKDGIMPMITPFFPIEALNNLIQIPFPKYIFREIQDYVSLKSVLIGTGWLTIYILLITFTLNKRDLK